MPAPTFPPFTFSPNHPGKRDILGLQTVLKKLGLEVAADEVSHAEIGATTKDAVRKIQKRAGLKADGRITPETVDAVRADAAHVFFAANKTRTAKLHDMLERLGHAPAAEERRARVFGKSTEKALKKFQKSAGLPQDGRMSEEVFARLEESALAERLSTKTQVALLQRRLMRAARIAKLELQIDPAELKARSLGPTTAAAVRAFQGKYRLPQTGELDPLTFERLTSVVSSRSKPAPRLHVRSADGLTTIDRALRLNMANGQVGALQRSLAFLGYQIDLKEFDTRTFGGSTREAVLKFQRINSLPLTGHLDGGTRKVLNAEIAGVQPAQAATEHPQRVRGAVRDDLWRGRSGLRVQVWEKTLRGDGTMLAERKTLANGFFDVPYQPPLDPVNGQIRTPLHLRIRVLDANGVELDAKVVFNPTPIDWVNFTGGSEPYRGTSEYEARMSAVSKALGGVAILDLEESAAREDVTHVALHADLSPEDVMRLILAHRAASALGDAAVPADVFYAFIRQNLPPTLPSNLLGSTEEWTLIEQLVEQTLQGIVFMDGDLQAVALEGAVRGNLIPIATGNRRPQILAKLAEHRQSFALEKPILSGNGSLEGLLNVSAVPPEDHSKLATVFLEHRGLGASFWTDLRSRAAEFGGDEAVADFETTARLGEISKHHLPTVTFLKQALADPAHPELNLVSDSGKLDQAQWVTLIQQNGGQVPAGIEGATAQERIDVFAASLVAQSERMFPAIALTADVARGAGHGLQKVPEVQQLLDENPDLDLRNANLDAFVSEKGLVVEPQVLAETRVLQRIHRIAPTAAVGRAVLEEKLHHSGQILFRGKERFAAALEAKGVARRAALTAFGHAEFQYSQVLARIADFRSELHAADPVAIVSHTYTAEEQQQLLGDTPSLEALFGALDFCDCAHCQSLFSPAAYLADVLRFLDSHLAEQPPKTVRDILFERRPDIGNIKLNCDNTNTPLPYIDLVCEILEGAVPAPADAPVEDRDFSFQTTRTAGELRAFPDHVRKVAYDVLREADFPMDIAFDLWQEEARVWLDHLGVPRHVLMETLQARPEGGDPTPLDVSIAGEYWGISSHETTLITTEDPTEARQNEFWGLDTTEAKVGVREFLAHAELEYGQLLELLRVRWINSGAAPGDLQIERPAASCDLALQSVINLTLQRFDGIHRFLRVWRRTGWKLWELDLLIRAPRLASGSMDPDALVGLRQFRDVQKALGLPFETTLAFYGEINTEVRIRPDDPKKTIEPLYHQLFQNRAVTDPVNPAFALPLAGGQQLADHKATLLAALALSDADLGRLIARTDGALTLANLTQIHNEAALARGLKITVERLIMLLDASGIADVFASPRDTLDLLELHGWVKGSGLEIDELDYLLNYRSDSPHGLREEAVTELIEGLRESLRGAMDDEREGRIISFVASATSLRPEQVRLLLEGLRLGGTPLLEHLNDPALTARDANDEYVTDVSLANFPALYRTFTLLHKVSLVIRRQKITSTDDLEWLLTAPARFGTLDFAALPTDTPPAAPLLPSWLVLRKWLDLRAKFPEPEDTSLRDVFDLAAEVAAAGAPATPLADLHGAIEALTRWPVADLQALHDALELQYDAAGNDYTSVDTYQRLAKAFKAVKRLGVGAELAATWALRDEDADDTQYNTARQIREAAKAKYDYATWLSKAGPLYDVLRDRKRTALARYLVERSLREEPQEIDVGGKKWRNPRHWRDSNDLLRYFLIDCEMSSCQPTSRIKQAMSSVQMFVQRCFLNLEQPDVQVGQEEKQDTVSPNSWKQWRYMKSYRVWEAARKVFLYPENWILPELRDDKSPFFKDMEDELLQGDVTQEHAEAAFVHYLQKVHEVANLEIVGAYHEIDDDDPQDDLPPNINVLHVVGRTRNDPAVYYYRRFDLNYGAWSAWEKVDLDITGDHLLPVVYNRKLHLFWLAFTEKPLKVKKQPPAAASSGPTNSPEPPKQLEIQLAWSVRQDGGWTTKKLSRERLIHPWERPLDSYHLKPRYKSRENILWLDLYISTSREFNDSRFYDPFKNDRQYLSASRFNETGRPWHSSSFLFDGAVVGVKMKPLSGFYHLVDATGMASDTVTSTTSYTYVHGGFGRAGLMIEPLVGGYEIAPRLPIPDGMHYQQNRLANNTVVPNPGRLTVLELGGSKTVLSGAKPPFGLVFSQDRIRFDTAAWGPDPFLYQDPQRSFFIRPEVQTVPVGYNQVIQRIAYKFFPFYHPYTALFLRELNRSGLDGLLNRRIQRFPETFYPGNGFRFGPTYAPAAPSAADATAERDMVDFAPYGAFSVYNWETFFHAPLMIACRLTQNQRFEEAMHWFHYIFDPSNVEALESPQRFWVTKPFFDQNTEDYRKQRIENLLRNLNANYDQLRAWRNDPFNPHRIARYRPIAYQKTVVMKYIDNLIAWADQLFARDTMETINEATVLYVLAYELLGARPVRVPPAEHEDLSYNELVAIGALDPLGNQSVAALVENFTAPPEAPIRAEPGAEPLPLLDVQYFGIPANDKLLGYWSTVEKQLFKIRHCMNIQGVVRQLPLFEPEIDPALLVKAAAMGIDIGSLLSPTETEQGQYRFRSQAARAAELCGEVRSLGERLLSALEKRDAEELSLLRSTHEVNVLQATRQVRKDQISESKETLAGLEKGKTLAEQKRDYYRGREFMSPWEEAARALSGGAALAETGIALGYILAGGLRFIPRFVVGGSGFGGSPHVTADVVDGAKIGDTAEDAVKTLQSIATALEKYAALAATQGSYNRRQEEWDFQGDLAETEIEQIDRQIVAAQLRQSIAEHELDNLELQIDQSNEAQDYLKSKYTNQQLYSWMLTQLATTYFQAYKQAYDAARRAERCLQFELARPDLSFIEFGYWDSLKKGLLAGDKLANDLRRMETAYIQQNTRELELTKHVSLAQVMPLSLLALKTSGECTVQLPEWLFDMDYLGHYRRRIKSVSVTIPCVVGPYTGVHCTLSLTKNGMRVNDTVNGDYGDPLVAGDDRFVSNRVVVGTVATSHGQNDTGLFELSFNDERFLPFEGAGAVSEWQITLPKEANPFDFASISDVVLHVKYTARAGDPALAAAAKTSLDAVLPPNGLRLLSLRHEFGGEWHRFLHPGEGADQTLTFRLKSEHFPFYTRNKTPRVTGIDLILESSYEDSFEVVLRPPGAPAAGPELADPDGEFGDAQHLAKDIAPPTNALGDWTLQIRKDTADTFQDLAPEDLRNAYLIVRFTTA